MNYPISFALSAGGFWNSFYNTYVGGGAYDNLGRGVSLPWIIIGLFFVLVIAAITSVIGKSINGRFVKKIISDGALSPETAKTLPELDSADKLFIRRAVKKGVNLRRVLRCVEEEKFEEECKEKIERYEQMREEDPKLPKKLKVPKFKVDPDNHHFYIPEELRMTAEVKFDQSGISVAKSVASVIVLVIAFFAVLIYMPRILNTLDVIFNIFKAK